MNTRFADRPLFTLDPKKMVDVGQDTYDLSGYIQADYVVIEGGRRVDPLPVCRTAYLWGRRNLRFPPETKGLLYYRAHEEDPIRGEVRFRICESAADFDRGHDLLGWNGVAPWSIPLLRLFGRITYTPLVYLLRKEGLVDTDLLSRLERQPPLNLTHMRILYTLDQPFDIQLLS